MDRREAVLAAVEQLVLRDGVHAVSMRAVAQEAGVSLRLVQYYGSSKADLLHGALDRLSEHALLGWQARLTAAKTARAVLTEFLNAALPTDEERRALHRFGVGLEQLALTDPDGTGRFYAIHIDGVIATLTDALARFIASDQATRIAESATAFSHGLGTLLMAESISARRAKALISDYLDQHV